MARSGETRQRILDKAVQLVSKLGFDGLSLGQLAENLRLSKSGVFSHFGSKEELQTAVLRRAAEEFTAEVLKPGLGAARGAERLVAIFEAWLRWAAPASGRGGCVFVAAATELDDRPGPVRDELVRLQEFWLTSLAKVFQVGQETGEFEQSVDSEQFAFELHGIMLSYHHQARLLRHPDAEARARRALEELLVRARGSLGPGPRYRALLERCGLVDEPSFGEAVSH